MANPREATLEELLIDPVILKVMASDGVRADDIRQLTRLVNFRMLLRRDASRAVRAVGTPSDSFQRLSA
ncbi:hypothetical protein [Mesorhizobium sp. L-8-3]|uniref:hypothetical protein n=1 Tax=Mesorhizobium sp. L-8-3 TaxID=2744522 RepID=UPI001926F61A|nr:hypothetical protein [Mesorhizobium sp. L-8-3]BCH23346.1 hypothetical protein MesoLjLb_31310 [Mesorhizobium sp. L-8-3]